MAPPLFCKAMTFFNLGNRMKVANLVEGYEIRKVADPEMLPIDAFPVLNYFTLVN